MFDKMKKLAVAAVTLVVATVAPVANAAIDVTAAVTSLGDIPIAVTAIGGAMLIAAGVAVGFKWAKASIFG